MREGTWTVEKPPGKTHSSQAKGVVESSGGVKRPHSDLSTPSQGKEQLQKLRCRLRYTRKLQLESRWRSSTHHPDANLDQIQNDIIQEKLLTAVDATPSGETPLQFLYSKFAQGVFWITCANESPKVWLMRTISGLGELWEGTELTG